MLRSHIYQHDLTPEQSYAITIAELATHLHHPPDVIRAMPADDIALMVAFINGKNRIAQYESRRR
jgi:hypothetical protein